MNGAVDDELVSVNPVQIRSAGASRRVKKIEPASLAELATLTAAMPDRLQLAVLLGAWCAMRYGEIAELRRRDLDLDRGKVRIRRGVTWVDGHPVVGPPKTAAGVRDVSIPPHLLPIVKDHLAHHTGPGPDALLFPATQGSQMWAPTFQVIDDRAIVIGAPSGAKRSRWGRWISDLTRGEFASLLATRVTVQRPSGTAADTGRAYGRRWRGGWHAAPPSTTAVR